MGVEQRVSEEIKAKVKALFPEDVEGIYISKNDYDRLYGDLTLENIELKKEIETEITLNKQLLKDIDKAGKEIERLNNIIKEVKEYIHWRYDEHQDIYKYQMEELLEILDKEGNVDE